MDIGAGRLLIAVKIIWVYHPNGQNQTYILSALSYLNRILLDHNLCVYCGGVKRGKQRYV